MEGRVSLWRRLEGVRRRRTTGGQAHNHAFDGSVSMHPARLGGACYLQPQVIRLLGRTPGYISSSARSPVRVPFLASPSLNLELLHRTASYLPINQEIVYN